MKKIGAWVVLSLLVVGASLWWMRHPPTAPVNENQVASTDPLWPLAESHAPAFQQEPLRETEAATEEEPEETVSIEMPEETPPAVRMGEERWAGGALKAQGPLKQRADGQWVKDGVWTNYWANGRINTFGQYEADEPVGTWPFWMDQGQALLPNQYRPPSSQKGLLLGSAMLPQRQAPLPAVGEERGEGGRASSTPTLTQNPAPLPAPVPVGAAASGDRETSSRVHPAITQSPSTVSQPSVRPPNPAHVIAQKSTSPSATKPPVADGPVVFTSSGCTATRWQSMDRNAAQVVATLRALFPEVLFEMDQRMGMLKATGCDRQLALLNPFFEAAVANEAGLWQALSEERLWNAGAQMGRFHHSVYGFDLKRPTGSWKTQSVVGDASWGARLGGKVLWGLTLSQKTARIMAVVLDVERPVTASELGEKDLRSPLGLWPQAAPERNWKHALSGAVVGPVGGLRAHEKTTYRSRVLWKVGAGKQQKVVRDRWYLAQPSVSGSSTRLYFFLLLLPEADFLSVGRAMDTFVAGFSMPESPMQPVVPPDSSLAQAFGKAGNNSSHPVKSGSINAAPTVVYQWRLHRSRSPGVQQALQASRAGKPKEAEILWNELLGKISGAERPEGLWYLARSQMGQGKYQIAIATFAQMEKEFPQHPLSFEAGMQRGMLLGHYLRHWAEAETHWQWAWKLAQDRHQKWRAACQLATVAYYKSQYRQARESLENLLKDYPTNETADFVRPYIWYLKNCVEKKI